MSNPYPDFVQRTWVYVAGPYSGGDTVVNIQAAVSAANLLWEAGLFPYIPHLTHLWHLITPKPYPEWLALDLQPLKKCDAVLRLPGESSGADKECKFAKALGIPVYTNMTALVIDLLGERPENWKEVIEWLN